MSDKKQQSEGVWMCRQSRCMRWPQTSDKRADERQRNEEKMKVRPVQTEIKEVRGDWRSMK